ncbi:MAG: coproporphyrinogen-III oxidase family protein [Sphaerochaetaceae bacterium]|jgi:oxygen-independent coproporphyrinogen-3 oxidase
MKIASSVPSGLFHSGFPVSLYIHVPFCVSKCDYCAFYSLPACRWDGGGSSLRTAYVERMAREIESCALALGRPFETVFFGGGNPGCLRSNELSRLLEAACLFGRPGECTVEMNPESLDMSFLPVLGRYADRLSMGVQSLDAQVLSALGRNTSLSRVVGGIGNAVELRRRYGVKLSFDLMTCVPGQDEASALNDIDSLVATAEPEHLSLYCLSVEEGTPLAMRAHELEEWDQTRMLLACWQRLSLLGYEHYEVSNFAQKGNRCLHNSRYWALEQYVGLGPAAAGTAFCEEGIVRWGCPADVVAYCAGRPFSGYRHEFLSKEEELEEYLLVALRVKEGINFDAFATRFGFSFGELLDSECLRTLTDGSYVVGTTSFACTENGWMVLDDLVLRLALAADRVRHSKNGDCPVEPPVAP